MREWGPTRRTRASRSPHALAHASTRKAQRGKCHVSNPNGRGLTFKFYERDTWRTVFGGKRRVGPWVFEPVRRAYGSIRLSAPVERCHVTHAGSATLFRSPVDAWQSLSLSCVCFKFLDVSVFAFWIYFLRIFLSFNP